MYSETCFKQAPMLIKENNWLLMTGACLVKVNVHCFSLDLENCFVFIQTTALHRRHLRQVELYRALGETMFCNNAFY